MGFEHDTCLDKRTSDIHAMLAGTALFQAGEMIKGGRQCAAMRACPRWADCARSHADLSQILSQRLSPSP